MQKRPSHKRPAPESLWLSKRTTQENALCHRTRTSNRPSPRPRPRRQRCGLKRTSRRGRIHPVHTKPHAHTEGSKLCRQRHAARPTAIRNHHKTLVRPPARRRGGRARNTSKPRASSSTTSRLCPTGRWQGRGGARTQRASPTGGMFGMHLWVSGSRSQRCALKCVSARH